MASSLRSGLLFGMGNPLLDISTNTDNDFLVKYDLKPDNAILAEEKHIPIYEEIVKKYDVEYTAGGSAQNSLKAAQWILEVPDVSVFMGCIGKDEHGELLKNKAKEVGINVQYQYDEKVPTGTCAVVITEKGSKRSLIANLAAANNFTKDHLEKPENFSFVENAEFFYMTGFFLTVSPESLMLVGEYAAKHNRIVSMNLSATFISEFFKGPLLNALPYVDILFGNEEEARVFAKVQNFETTDLKEIALKICDLPKVNQKRTRITIITRAKDPAIVTQNNKVCEYPVIEVPEDKIIDTNGAGDAFVGGFLAQLIQNHPLETCMKCGFYCASEVIQQSGAIFPNKHSFTP